MGSLGFWPLTVFLPISMHIVQHNIPRWSTKWILMHSLQVFCFFISVTAMIGSIVGVIEVGPACTRAPCESLQCPAHVVYLFLEPAPCCLGAYLKHAGSQLAAAAAA